MIVCGFVTFFTLMSGISAPYGRYSTSGWGFFIESKTAWVTQELWSFLVPAVWLSCAATPDQIQRVRHPPNAALLALFLLHYFHRDFIFPLRLRGGKPTPFVVWLSAAVFCIYNGYMQTRHLLVEAPLDSSFSPRFLLGVALWAAGWAINLHADSTLINLRKPGETGYKIPRGGVFDYVSAANYFGEMVEWGGWALASWSLPAAAFAFFTFANLAPRGWHHHQWYLRKFPSYPKHRRAVIPFVW